MGVGGHLSAAMTGSQLQCVRTSKALKTKLILQIIMTLKFNELISHSSEFDPHVPVVDAVQQIFNKLLVFPVKTLNSITICTSCVKHQFKLCAKSLTKKKNLHFIVGVNLLNRLSVLLLLLFQTFCYFIFWWDRIQRTRISTNHKLFCNSAALTVDLVG